MQCKDTTFSPFASIFRHIQTAVRPPAIPMAESMASRAFSLKAPRCLRSPARACRRSCGLMFGAMALRAAMRAAVSSANPMAGSVSGNKSNGRMKYPSAPTIIALSRKGTDGDLNSPYSSNAGYITPAPAAFATERNLSASPSSE